MALVSGLGSVVASGSNLHSPRCGSDSFEAQPWRRWVKFRCLVLGAAVVSLLVPDTVFQHGPGYTERQWLLPPGVAWASGAGAGLEAWHNRSHSVHSSFLSSSSESLPATCSDCRGQLQLLAGSSGSGVPGFLVDHLSLKGNDSRETS